MRMTIKGGDSIPSTAEAVATDYEFRKPNEEDGANVWSLVKSTGVLDLNSSYSYLMWCKFFHDTSIVVEEDGRIVGFISGFIKPETPEILFIWQVAVHESQRERGLATKMLRHILDRTSCEDIHYLEATVSPSNVGSQRLFKGLAEKQETKWEIHDCFTADDFPGEGHEDEELYRIGPLKNKDVAQI